MRWIISLWILCETLTGCAAPAGKESPANDDPGRKLYVNKCAKCHKFYDPAKYSDQEWKVWMGKMSKKSKLTPEQEQTLSRYIEETYRAKR